MKINKWSFIVSVINIVLAGLAIYVLKEYEHRTDIVSSQHPITDFHILEVNRSGGFKGGSSVKIAYNSKEYYTGIPITRCKTEDVEKLAITTTRRTMPYSRKVNLTEDMSCFISSCFYVRCYFGYIPKCEKRNHEFDR